MGSFNGLLDAKFMPPRNWSLDAPLKFKSETLTDEEISGYLAANPNASNAQIAEGMDKFNISSSAQSPEISKKTSDSAADLVFVPGSKEHRKWSPMLIKPMLFLIFCSFSGSRQP